MNYDHAFHVGNQADLLKHALFASLLQMMTQKPKPLVVIDAFAGEALYDLMLDDRAQRGGEWRSAAALLWEASPRKTAFDRLWRGLHAERRTDSLRWHPGSPWIARALLRADDKLYAIDAKPAAIEALTRALGADRRVKVLKGDAWSLLDSLTPPTPRRGVVLLDPPYEAAEEFDRALRTVARLLRRWSVGVVALWWPETAATPPDFEPRLRDAASGAPVLRSRLSLDAAPTGLKRSCFAVVNPPYRFDAAAAAESEAVAGAIGADAETAWLHPPR